MTLPGPAYRIITARMVLRAADPKDTQALHDAIRQSRENLLPWMGWAKSESVSLQDRLDYLRNARGNFDLDTNYEYLLFDRSESTFVGAAGLHKRKESQARAIGYWIHKDHINHGYATEATAALTRVAFEIHHAKLVEILCDPENIRSRAIPRKLGFIHEATLHHRIEDATAILKDTMVWTLFENDYLGCLASKMEIQAYDAIGRQII